MSYEGYAQLLCQNGHYQTLDTYEEPSTCTHCGAKFVWRNEVDDTNCDSWGYVDIEPFCVTQDEFKTCDMGHQHLVSYSTYRIPTPEETRAARMYQNSDSSWEHIEQVSQKGGLT